MNNKLIPTFLIIGGIVLIFGAIVGLILLDNGLHEDSLDENYVAVAGPYSEIQRIDLAAAKAAYDRGEIVFLDVREEIYYSEKHISGAISIPEDELDNRFSELSRQDLIITYCT